MQVADRTATSNCNRNMAFPWLREGEYWGLSTGLSSSTHMAYRIRIFSPAMLAAEWAKDRDSWYLCLLHFLGQLFVDCFRPGPIRPRFCCVPRRAVLGWSRLHRTSFS